MRAATTLSALALLAWLTRRPRPAVVAFLDRLLHALALLGLRVSTAAGLLAHRVLHACHVYWTQRRARVGDISDASSDSDGCKAPALIPRNTSIHVVRGSSQRAAPPRAVGQSTPVLPPVGGCQQRLPRDLVALGPVPDGCVVERIPLASAPTTALGAVDDGQGGVGGGGAAPALSFSFQGCAWMMHCTWRVWRRPQPEIEAENPLCTVAPLVESIGGLVSHAHEVPLSGCLGGLAD
jgi:hypothetical protein